MISYLELGHCFNFFLFLFFVCSASRSESSIWRQPEMDRGGTATSIGMTSLRSDTKRFLEETFVDGWTAELSRGGSPRHFILKCLFSLFFARTNVISRETLSTYFVFLIRLQVVGSQARILYSDQRGRVALAQAFNKGISEGRLQVSTVFFSLKCTGRLIFYIALGCISYQLIFALHKKPSRKCGKTCPSD